MENNNKPLNFKVLSSYYGFIHPAIVKFLNKFEEQTVWSEPIIVNKLGKRCIDITGRYFATDGTSTQVIHCVLSIIKRSDSHSFFLTVNEKRIPLVYNYDIEEVVYMIMYAIPEQYRDPEVLKVLSKLVSTDHDRCLSRFEKNYENSKHIIEMLGLKDSKHVKDHLVSGNDAFQDIAMIRTYCSILADTAEYNHRLNSLNNTKLFDLIKYAFEGMIEDAAKHNNHITEWIRCKWFHIFESDIDTNHKLRLIWSFCYGDPVVFNTVVHKLYIYFTNIDNEKELKEKLYVKLPHPLYIDDNDRDDMCDSISELIKWETSINKTTTITIAPTKRL